LIVGTREAKGEYGHTLNFNSENIAVYLEGKREYLPENTIVKRIK
jgi:hypothetical protein